jgi:transcriptional regulator with GAF, ATPase, and Fis domain
MSKSKNTADEELQKLKEDCKNIKAQYTELLQFSKIGIDIAAKFVNAQPDTVDKIVKESLEELVDYLNVDIGTLRENRIEEQKFIVTHSTEKKDTSDVEDITIPHPDLPYYSKILTDGQMFIFSHPDEITDEGRHDKEWVIKHDIKSHIAVPVEIGGELIGTLAFTSITKNVYWNMEVLQNLVVISKIFGNALYRKNSDKKLKAAYDEISLLKDKLQDENIVLQEEIILEHNPEMILGDSKILKEALYKLEQVSPTEATILLLGETGVGKELFARAAHTQSKRHERPLIKVNCAALPSNLIESELFGHEKGAFTGAVSSRKGRFELADKGTIFLDEIGELPLELQSKLLRVLQEGEIEKLGSSEVINVDCRVIAATNRNLSKEVEEGKFREDLFYRLNVFPIQVPALRERIGDLKPLVEKFVSENNKKLGRKIKRISNRTMQNLINYSWPGNIRELQNVIERAMILSQGEELNIADSDSPAVKAKGSTQEEKLILSLEEHEKKYIIEILKKTNGKIFGAGGAGELLGIHPETLRSRMKKLGIKKKS